MCVCVRTVAGGFRRRLLFRGRVLVCVCGGKLKEATATRSGTTRKECGGGKKHDGPAIAGYKSNSAPDVTSTRVLRALRGITKDRRANGTEKNRPTAAFSRCARCLVRVYTGTLYTGKGIKANEL